MFFFMKVLMVLIVLGGFVIKVLNLWSVQLGSGFLRLKVNILMFLQFILLVVFLMNFVSFLFMLRMVIFFGRLLSIKVMFVRLLFLRIKIFLFLRLFLLCIRVILVMVVFGVMQVWLNWWVGLGLFLVIFLNCLRSLEKVFILIVFFWQWEQVQLVLGLILYFFISFLFFFVRIIWLFLKVMQLSLQRVVMIVMMSGSGFLLRLMIFQMLLLV